MQVSRSISTFALAMLPVLTPVVAWAQPGAVESTGTVRSAAAESAGVARPAATPMAGMAGAMMEPFKYGHYVPSGDSTRPRIKFNDSLVSANSHCPVTTSKLNLRIQPLYINGQAIGFC